MRFVHFGRQDPTGFADHRGLAKAYVSPLGEVTVHVARVSEDELRVRAWGPGAAHAIAAAPALVGHLDDPARFEPLRDDVARRFRAQAGLRLVRVAWPVDTLVQLVLQQRVRFVEAARAYRTITQRHGGVAPGPFDLVVALDARGWLAVPAHELSRLSVDKKRIDTVRAVCKLSHHVAKVERHLDAGAGDEARRILSLFPGVGPWTREKFLDEALGDPDAVATGDVHLPRIVCGALEPSSDVPYSDARMLELLAPWKGQRARVVRLVLSTEGAYIRI